MRHYLTFIRPCFYLNSRQNRHFWMALFFNVLAILFIATNGHAEANNPSITKNDKKILIVYYSRSDNTEFVAKHIHDQVGGDMLRLETVEPYPEQYRATTI